MSEVGPGSPQLPEGFKLTRRYSLLTPPPGPRDKSPSSRGHWVLQTPIGNVLVNHLLGEWRLLTSLNQPDLGDPNSSLKLHRWLSREGLLDQAFLTRRDAVLTLCEGMRRSGVI